MAFGPLAPPEAPDLLVISHLRWLWNWQRPQQIVSRLAKHRRTWFVEEPVAAPVDSPRMRWAEHGDITRLWLEYLAAGLPVVSTRVPDVVSDYGDLVDFQDDGAGFAQACKRARRHSAQEREAKGTIQPWLRENNIWSRGRFGAWLYEIGNMDHSTMQGVEFVNKVLLDEPETVWIPRGEGAEGEGIR